MSETWAPNDLADYTLAELAHYLGKTTPKAVREWKTWLHANRGRERDGVMMLFYGNLLPIRKVRGIWLVNLTDYLKWKGEWHYRSLSRVWRKVQGELMRAYAKRVPAYSLFRTVKRYKVR